MKRYFLLALVALLVLPGCAAAQRRNPWVWPFTSRSIWNTPIGSSAQYGVFYATRDANGGEVSAPGIAGGVDGSGAGMTLGSDGLPQGWGYGVNFGVDPNFMVTTKNTDPLQTVWQQDAWGPGRCNGTTQAQQFSGGPVPWKIRVPNSLVIPDAAGGATPNNPSAIVQPNGSIFSFSVTARCTAGANDFHGTPSWQFTPGVSTKALAADANIRSTGTYGGHGGSGMSSYGGVITTADLKGTAPIHHSLSVDINGAEYLNWDVNAGHVWPAATQDAAAWNSGDWYGGYHGHYPFLKMGSLLAVPPDVTAASLGLTDPAAIKIFHALQDYGAYVVDDTGWSSVDINVTPAAANSVYAGLPGSPWGGTQPRYNDLMAVYGQLRVVTNNSPASIGGGGTPRRPLAPPL